MFCFTRLKINFHLRSSILINFFQLLLTHFIFIISYNTLAQDFITISVSEWKPYYSQDMSNLGIQASTIKEAFNKVGIRTKFIWHPTWKSALNTAKAGRYHATSGWRCNKTRSKDFLFSPPVGLAALYFFHLKSFTFDWKSFDDLKDYGLIAKTKGYSFGKAFDLAEQENKFKVLLIRKDTLIFDILLHDRAKLAPFDKQAAEFMFEHELAPHYKQKITHHPKPVSLTYTRILFNKKNPRNLNFSKQFKLGLAALQQERSLNIQSSLLVENCIFKK